MIQTETIRASGVPEHDIRQLEAAWDAFQNAKKHAPNQTPHIACTGIYDTGKSTLLNALAGEDIFATGDVPTTKKVAQAEFGGAVYIDTPGLNATEEDDQETQTAYETADFILFVASAQNGGISAAEAGWLQRLNVRCSNLQQRLIYVLTHCTQVDPSQLPAIQEQVRKDFVRAVEFEPEEIFCVDSITYQRGKQGNKGTLIEHSGILQLQVRLAEHIASAEKILQEAQKAELAARRQTVQEQITRISASVRAEIDKAEKASQEKIAQVDRAWTEFEKALQEAMPIAEPGRYSTFVSLGYNGSSTIKERSESSAHRKLETQLRSYYNRRESAAREAVFHSISGIRSDWCSTGPDSAYAKQCSKINEVFETSILTLQKLGVPISFGSGIAVSPDIPSDLARQVEQEATRDLVDYGECYTLSEYVEMYAYVSSMEEYVKGMFGIEHLVMMYTIYGGYDVIREMEKDLQKNVDRNAASVRMMVNRYYQAFKSKLISEAENRKAAIKRQVDTYKSSLTQTTASACQQNALTYLDALNREVSQ